MLGEALPKGDGALKAALERVRRYTAGRFKLEIAGEPAREEYLVARGGDRQGPPHRAVRDVHDATSPTVRLWREREANGKLTLPLPVTLNREVAIPALLELKDELDWSPVDARLDLDKRELVKEVVGRELDIDGTLSGIEDALAKGERSARVAFLERKPATRRGGARQRFSSTTCSATSRPTTTAPSGSRRAATTCGSPRRSSTGTVLLPGEVFDFNAVVGPRDEANGYKSPPSSPRAKLVDGIGGGTCQIAGTCTAQPSLPGSQFVERYPHTRPSSYIKMGLDATVVYPTINFRFRNPFPFPGRAPRDGEERPRARRDPRARSVSHTVTLIRRMIAAIPYEEVERPGQDTGRAAYARLAQRGVPGSN